MARLGVLTTRLRDGTAARWLTPSTCWWRAVVGRLAGELLHASAGR